MTLLLKAFTGSCSPPKLPRIFHRIDSQVENSVCFSLHFIVSALNFQGCFEILGCFSWLLDVHISKERKLVCRLLRHFRPVLFLWVLQAIWAFERGDIFSTGTSKYIFPFLVLCEEAWLAPASSCDYPWTGCKKAAPEVLATEGRKWWSWNVYLFTGHIPVDLKALIGVATVAAFPYA